MSRLEWCAVAEPRLLKMPADPIAAFERLKTLAGSARYVADYAAAQRPVPVGRDSGLYGIECFEDAHPRGDKMHRVYSGQVCCRVLASVGFGSNGEACGCMVCDLARDLGILEAVAASEKANKA